MAGTQSFADLMVYKKAFDSAIEVHKASLTFPKNEQYALADQMRRSSKSICANIAEGYGKQSQSQQEFRRFLSIALGSANEMLVWTDFSRTLGYVDEVTSVRWKGEYDHICRMLNKLYGSISTPTSKRTSSR